MHIYSKIYAFAASLGAFEGYVYKKEKIGPNELKGWVSNLLTAYNKLPKEAVQEFQPLLDGTLGRALKSLIPILREDHPYIQSLKTLIVGEMPRSADDFQKKKWFDKTQ